jgi:hypothetical protein
VEPGQLAGQRVVQDGLVDERVPEAVGPRVPVGQEQAMVDTGPQRLVEGDGVDGQGGRVGGGRQHGRQQVVLDLPPADGARPQHGGRLGRHVLHPGDDGVAQLWRHGRLGILGEGRGQLLDEQGVPVGALDDAGRQLGARRGGQQRTEQLGDIAGAEALERELERAPPPQLGGQSPQRVAGRHVVAAVGGDQQDGQRAGVGGEQRHEIERGPVGPVQVLDDENERPRGHEPLDDGEQQLEQPRLPERAAGAAAAGGRRYRLPPGVEQRPQGSQRGGPVVGGQVAGERAQDVEQGRVGRPALLQVEALPDEHPRPSPPGVRPGLADQPGLADPGLPGHERGGTPAVRRLAERLDHGGQLGGPADECGRRAAQGHEGIIAPEGSGPVTRRAGASPVLTALNAVVVRIRCQKRRRVRPARGPLATVRPWSGCSSCSPPSPCSSSPP